MYKKEMFSAFAHVSSVDVGMVYPAGQARNIQAFVLYKLDLLFFWNGSSWDGTVLNIPFTEIRR